MKTKTCTKCLRAKPLSKFYEHVETRDGLQSWCKACFKKYRGKDRRLDANLRYRYDGFTLVEYDAMLEGQGGCCAICGKTPAENNRRLATDHNHETGEVRGLLCDNCNRALGLLQDSPEVCRRAMLYLRMRL